MRSWHCLLCQYAVCLQPAVPQTDKRSLHVKQSKLSVHRFLAGQNALAWAKLRGLSAAATPDEAAQVLTAVLCCAVLCCAVLCCAAVLPC